MLDNDETQAMAQSQLDLEAVRLARLNSECLDVPNVPDPPVASLKWTVGHVCSQYVLYDDRIIAVVARLCESRGV